jgi:hypothetical protein
VGKRPILGSFAGAGGALLLAACSAVLGINEDYRLTDATGGAAGATGTGGSGGSGGTGPAGLNCAELAQLFCGFRGPCCGSLYSGQLPPGWPDACVDTVAKQCEGGVASLNNGHTYRAEMWDECKSKLAGFKPQCFGSYKEVVEVATRASACVKIITGPVPAGGTCKSQVDCAYLDGDGKVMLCSNQICVPRGKLTAGELCLPGPGSCGPELHCTVLPGEKSGSCIGNLLPGSKCDADLECGVGSRCVTGSCQLGLPNGQACTQGLECQSTLCIKNLCLPLPVFSLEACQGTALY